MAQFCTRCGAPQTEGMQFCTVCGASSGPPPSPVPQAPSAPVVQTPAAPVAPPPVAATPGPDPAAPKASSGGSCLKTALGCLGILIILGVLIAAAGAWFYYHRIKPKVAQIENTVRSLPIPTGAPQVPTQPGAPGGRAPSPGGPGGGSGSGPASPTSPADIAKMLQQLGVKVDPNSPLAKLQAVMNRPEPHFPALNPGDPSLDSGQLVFQPGMTIALSISEPLVGDYDVLISITSVSALGVASNISAQLPGNSQGATSPANAAVLKSHEAHLDAQQDLLHATHIFPYFAEQFPQVIPGSTSFHLSQDSFQALKTGTPFVLTFPRTVTESSLHVAPRDFWSSLNTYTCHGARSEAVDAAFPLLINGRRVTVPAIHMACPHDSGSGAEYVLDDAKMALFLAAWNGQTTQINFPPLPSGGGGQSIEQALKKEGRVDVYGIYFDFASDKLRPESRPVLEEIAAALRNNPTWKLHVNGHTDNIGGDAYNLDLSNRRAAAVKQALVTQYLIDPARLDPQGFGASQPKESNDTMAGRARNRRVELIRE